MLIKNQKMITTRIEKSSFEVPSRIIIEVPLTYDMIDDCFMFNAIDSASEIKLMLMECLGNKIDEIIQKEHEKRYGTEDAAVRDFAHTKKILDRIEVRYKK